MITKRNLLSLLSVLAICATPAFAGGPIAQCAPGQAFVWGGGGAGIPFNPDQGDLVTPGDHAAAVALVQSAFQVWEDVSTATASYDNAGELPEDVTGANVLTYWAEPAPDGLSPIIFDFDGSAGATLGFPSGVLGVAGIAWINTITCEAFEGVALLIGPTFAGNPTAAFDVTVHEFGHYSGLGHTIVNGQIYLGSVGGDNSGPTPNDTFTPIPDPFTEVVETMYPFYYGPPIGTATLHKDDESALSTLYPEPTFFSSTGTIAGSALFGSTPVTGVNVIARNVADPFLDAVSAISGDFSVGGDAFVGQWTINGLTPGADYAVYLDEILAGGFSVPSNGLSPLPGPEDLWNGADESEDPTVDDPSLFDPITVAAGSPVTGIDIIFNQFAPGDPLPVGLDGSVQLSLPFTYELCGNRYDSVFVNANGNLTFGAPNSDWTESSTEFLAGPPRIAALWDDFNNLAGGVVTYYQSNNDFTVVWDGVPEYFATGSNTFSITLKESSNHVDVEYGLVTATDGLAGVSCGGAVTSSFEVPSDLSSFAPSRINLHNQPAVYELFGFSNPGDLEDSTVRYNGTTHYNDNWAEPNDDPSKARQISVPFDSIPVTRFTEIEPAGGDIDFYRFSADGGTTVIIDVIAGQLDSLIALFKIEGMGNSTDYVFVDSDDDGGAGLLSKLQVPIAESGDYLLAVTTYPDFGLTGAGGSGGRYVLDIFAVDGIVLGLGDDDTQEIGLGFNFPYQGGNYTSVYVNSNGNLTFGSGDTDWSESVADFLAGPPRIAPLWDDLSPNNGGQVVVEYGSGSAKVSFVGVPEFFATGSNTFSVTMYDDGTYEVAFGAVSATDGITGSTEGNGAADPGPTDLSAGGPFPAAGTTYEQFTFGNPFDLTGANLSFLP